MSEERIQKTIEERDAKTAAAPRAEGIAKEWGLPWLEPSRKGQWGRMSLECTMKRQL